jgi:hypothetical protein
LKFEAKSGQQTTAPHRESRSQDHPIFGKEMPTLSDMRQHNYNQEGDAEYG